MAAPDPRVPELVGGVDIRALPLTALDGFVFSRIDGRSTVSDIVAMTGLAADQVEQILIRLAQLGAVRLPARQGAGGPTAGGVGDPVRPSERSSVPHTSSRPPRRRSSPGYAPPRRLLSESSISAAPPDLRGLSSRPGKSSPPVMRRTPPPVRGPSERSLPPAARQAPEPEPQPSAAHSYSADTRPIDGPLYDARELDEPIDLPIERRKQVLELYYRLPQLDYYGRLGVATDADRKEIRAAYFSLSKAFHPDSMFRKELGSYKAKMTAVFQALTEAYDTLGKKKSREEYDAYLRSTHTVEQVERSLATEQVPAGAAEVEVPPPPPLPSMGFALPPATPVPEVSPEARKLARDVIARRLRGFGLAPPPSTQHDTERMSPSEPSPAPKPRERKEIAKGLTRALMDVGKVSGSADNKIGRVLSVARSAFERGELAEAVRQVGHALSLAPDRSDIHAEYERLSRMLANQLADRYAEQARFEAKHAKWDAAAQSWAKVCDGRPEDAHAHRSAAYALLKAGSELRSALKYAQRAVFLAPTDLDCRVLLAQAYLTVGLKLNAKRELDAAAKLDPNNEMVKNLLSDLKV